MPNRLDDMTNAQRSAILKLVRAGDKPQDAFLVAGFSRTSYRRWMQMVRDDVEPHVSFALEVEREQAGFRSDMRAKILRGDERGCSFGPAKAALEVMARRFPKDWAPRLKHELEDAERLYFDALELVCSNPNVLRRVIEEQDLRLVFTAVCEEIARLDGEEQTEDSPSGTEGGRSQEGSPRVH